MIYFARGDNPGPVQCYGFRDPPASQCIQKIHQIGLLGRGEIHLKAGIIKRHELRQRIR